MRDALRTKTILVSDFRPSVASVTVLITTFYALEWRVFVDQYRPIIMVSLWYTIAQVWPSYWLWGNLIMVGCVVDEDDNVKSGLKGLSQLAVRKASAFGLGLFSQLRIESSSGFILCRLLDSINCSLSEKMVCWPPLSVWNRLASNLKSQITWLIGSQTVSLFRCQVPPIIYF